MPERLVARLLSEWRAAARRAEAAPTGSLERQDAEFAAERRRIAYQKAAVALQVLTEPEDLVVHPIVRREGTTA